MKKVKFSDKYLMLQTAVGDYRQTVLNNIVKTIGEKFIVLSGSKHFEATVATDVELNDQLKIINNNFIFKRKILFQFKAVFPSIAAKSLILEINPRIFTNWFIILARKSLRRKTVLWGHAWPREGKNAKSDWLRQIFRKLGSHILVYTDSEIRDLQLKMPRHTITSAPNALYSKNDMWTTPQERRDFIYVGRLVKTKKPRLLIEAYAQAIKSNTDIGKLIIVGDGPERKPCEDLVKSLSVSDFVDFKGHISDLDTLRELYSKSVASVSPGYVGLSITQSFSFGTPMIIADDEPHAPEIEAAVDEVNALFFTADSVGSLEKKLLDTWQKRMLWGEKESEIIANCQINYSTETMSEKIIEAFVSCQR